MAHLKMSEQWNSVIEDFERNYPDLADEVVDWYPVAQMEIAVKLRNGTRLIYELIGNTTRSYYEPEKHTSVDETIWRNEFASKLTKKMRYMGINRERLSMETGISTVTLSKYMNGKATPSGYNLDRLSKALKCSIHELTYIE